MTELDTALIAVGGVVGGGVAIAVVAGLVKSLTTASSTAVSPPPAQQLQSIVRNANSYLYGTKLGHAHGSPERFSDPRSVLSLIHI